LNVEVQTSTGAFFPLAFSPDGARLSGRLLTPQGNVPAIYTLASQSVEPQRDRGGKDFGSWSTNTVWLPDARRILAWDRRRDVATLWDTVSQEVRDVSGLPGPSDIAMSADGRTLILNRQVAEGDIWMLALD